MGNRHHPDRCRACNGEGWIAYSVGWGDYSERLCKSCEGEGIIEPVGGVEPNRNDFNPDDRIDPSEEAAREAARITAAGTAAAYQLTSRRLRAAVLRLAGRMVEADALEAAGPPDAKWSWEMLKLPDAARVFHWEGGEGAGGARGVE